MASIPLPGSKASPTRSIPLPSTQPSTSTQQVQREPRRTYTVPEITTSAQGQGTFSLTGQPKKDAFKEVPEGATNKLTWDSSKGVMKNVDSYVRTFADRYGLAFWKGLHTTAQQIQEFIPNMATLLAKDENEKEEMKAARAAFNQKHPDWLDKLTPIIEKADATVKHMPLAEFMGSMTTQAAQIGLAAYGLPTTAAFSPKIAAVSNAPLTSLSAKELLVKSGAATIDGFFLGGSVGYLSGGDAHDILHTAIDFAIPFGATSPIKNPVSRTIVAGVSQYGIARAQGETNEQAASRALMTSIMVGTGSIFENNSQKAFLAKKEYIDKVQPLQSSIKEAIRTGKFQAEASVPKAVEVPPVFTGPMKHDGVLGAIQESGSFNAKSIVERMKQETEGANVAFAIPKGTEKFEMEAANFGTTRDFINEYKGVTKEFGMNAELRKALGLPDGVITTQQELTLFYNTLRTEKPQLFKKVLGNLDEEASMSRGLFDETVDDLTPVKGLKGEFEEGFTIDKNVSGSRKIVNAQEARAMEERLLEGMKATFGKDTILNTIHKRFATKEIVQAVEESVKKGDLTKLEKILPKITEREARMLDAAVEKYSASGKSQKEFNQALSGVEGPAEAAKKSNEIARSLNFKDAKELKGLVDKELTTPSGKKLSTIQDAENLGEYGKLSAQQEAVLAEAKQQLAAIKQLENVPGEIDAKRALKLREMELEAAIREGKEPPAFLYEGTNVEKFITKNYSKDVATFIDRKVEMREQAPELVSPNPRINELKKAGAKEYSGKKGFFQRVREKAVATKKWAEDIFIYKASVKKYPGYKNDYRLFSETFSDIAAKDAIAVANITHKLAKIEDGGLRYGLFSDLVRLSDFERRAMEGQTLPLKLSLQDVRGELVRVNDLIANKGLVEVLDAYKLHNELMTAVLQDLKLRGKLLEVKENDPYFHHQVLEYARSRESIGKGPAKSGGYLKEAEGSSMAINLDYNATMHDYLMRVHLDNAMEDFLKREAIKYDLLNTLTMQESREILGVTETGVVKDLALNRDYVTPEGTYRAFQPNTGNTFFKAETLEGRMIDRAIRENASMEEIARLIQPGSEAHRSLLAVGGKKEMMLIPKEIALDMENLRTFRGERGNELWNSIRTATSAWKSLTLDFAFVPFQFGNFVGDMMNLYRDDLGAFTKIKQSFDMMYRGKYTDAAQEMLHLGLQQRVLGKATAFVAPSGSIQKFPAYFSKESLSKNKFNPFAWIADFSFRREGVLRMAKFMKDVERVRSGKSVVVKSLKMEDLKGLTGIEQAGKVSREIFVDYGAVSAKFKQNVSGVLFPFATFYVQNAKNWGNYVKQNPAEFGLKFGVPFAAATVWNNTGDRKVIEDNLPEWIRYQPHIITGFKAENGKDIVITLATPLNLAVKFLGLDTLPKHISELAKGEVSVANGAFGIIKDVALAAPRMAWRLVSPTISTVANILKNKDFVGRPIYDEEDTPAVQNIDKIKYAMSNLFAPYAQAIRANQAIEERAPTAEYIARTLMMPLGIKPDEGVSGLFGGVGIKNVDSFAGITSRTYEKRLEQEQKLEVYMDRVKETYLKSLFNEEYSREQYAGDFDSILTEAESNGIYISAEQVHEALSSDSFDLMVQKKELNEAKTPEEREELRTLLNEIRQESIIDNSNKAIKEEVADYWLNLLDEYEASQKKQEAESRGEDPDKVPLPSQQQSDAGSDRNPIAEFFAPTAEAASIPLPGDKKPPLPGKSLLERIIPARVITVTPEDIAEMKAVKKTGLVSKWAEAIATFEGDHPTSRASRNNNPGNLKFVAQAEAKGKDAGGFAIFKTREDGIEALESQLVIAATGKSKVYSPDMTILQFFQKYAPAADKNNPKRYAEFVAGKLGVPVTTKIRELVPQPKEEPPQQPSSDK